jgi:hypothetical protein
VHAVEGRRQFLLEGGERRPMPAADALGRGGDWGWVVTGEDKVGV